MTHLSYDTVIAELLARVPELQEDYDENADIVGGLPTMWLADVARYTVELYRSLPRDADVDHKQSDVLRRILDFLEEGVTSGDEMVDTAIATGYMEALDPSDPAFISLYTKMGPATRKLMRDVWADELAGASDN